jgi:hypothetical protein
MTIQEQPNIDKARLRRILGRIVKDLWHLSLIRPKMTNIDC